MWSFVTDFENERRLLLEFVGPELQIVYDEHQIEIEIVDMHFGNDEYSVYDPRLLEDHLSEIRTCHKLSRGCFFIVSRKLRSILQSTYFY